MVAGELGVHPLVEFAIARAALVQGLEPAVVLRQLLLDDVGLDGDAQVVGLAGQVGGHMVVLVFLEGLVAQVAPEDGRHAQFMGQRKGLGDLDDLAGCSAPSRNRSWRRRPRRPCRAASLTVPKRTWLNLLG